MTVQGSIVANLITRLKAMTTTGGYSVTYVTVEEWRTMPYVDSELPAIDVRDGEVREIANGTTFVQWELDLMIGVTAKGDTDASTIRAMLQDVQTCIGRDTSCGGYTDDVKLDGYEIVMSWAEEVYSGVVLNYKLQFSTSRWNLESSIP